MPPRTCFLQVNTAFWQPVYSWDPWASLPDWISLRQSFLGGFYPAYRWNSHARAKQWRNLSAALKEHSSSLTGFSYPAGWPAALQKSEVIRNKAEMLKQIPHLRFHRTQAPGSPFLQLSFLRDLPLCSLVYTCTRRKWGREYSLLRTNHHLKSAKLISLTWLPEPELRRHPLTFSFQFRYLSKAGPVFVSEMPTCITKTALIGSSKAWILMTSALAAPTPRRKCFVFICIAASVLLTPVYSKKAHLCYIPWMETAQSSQAQQSHSWRCSAGRWGLGSQEPHGTSSTWTEHLTPKVRTFLWEQGCHGKFTLFSWGF